jgi:trimethylamine--corrinoid protein Co-methyltransferase
MKYLSFLSNDEMNQIHNASLQILKKTGMKIDHLEALKKLEAAGAKVNFQTRVVKLPFELIEKSLENLPKTIVFAGRHPNNDMELKVGGNIFCRTTSGPTHYVNLETGKYKRAKIDDMKQFAILGDGLPNINGNGTLHAEDVPKQTADIHSLRVLFENTEKHIYAQSFSVKNLSYMIEMLLAISGSKEEVKKRPLLHIVIGVISPLYIPEDDVNMLILAGEYGIPVGMCVVPNSGVTGPMTLAGCIAQGNAEMLGSMTLAQISNPGHPSPYYWIPMIGDMVTGAGFLGKPETTIQNAALSQMGTEFYKLPVMSGGLFADTAIIEQLILQKSQSALVAALAGANLIIGAGSTDTGLAFSPIQLVIDNEIMGIIRRICRRFDINDETLAIEALHRVGPQGNFLSDEHTLKYLRSSEHYIPEILNYENQATWSSKGSKSLEERAREKAQTLLKEPKINYLSEEVVKELKLIVANADKELAM